MILMIPAAYKEIMGHLTVTEEMRSRILQNIQNVPLPKRRNRPRFFYGAAAACLAFLIAGSAAVFHFQTPIPQNLNSTVTNRPVFQAEEAASLSELSQMVGFTIREPALPFQAETVTYTAIGESLAQIQYLGAEETATYRVIKGSEDPSGDFTQYEDIQEVILHGISVQLKGTDSSYYLALWQDQNFSYSLHLSQGVGQDEWETILGDLLVSLQQTGDTDTP